MSTLPGKTVLVTGRLAANGYLASVGPQGIPTMWMRRGDHERLARAGPVPGRRSP